MTRKRSPKLRRNLFSERKLKLRKQEIEKTSHNPTPAVLSRLFGFLSLAFVFGPGVIGWISKLTSLSNALMIPVVSLFIVGLLAGRGLEHLEAGE